MYKIMTFLLLMMSFLIISCGDESKEECKDWEHFDTSRDKCVLNENACNIAMECIRANDLCKNNECITPVNCAEWEDYNEDTNTCSLKADRCYTDTDCTLIDNQHCDLTSHLCKDNLTIEWTDDCPSYLHANAECAMVALPMDYNNPDGKTMDIFIFRHLSKSTNVKGQVWFLQGGPGGSGSIFSKYMFEDYLQKYPDYDYYSLDHRGVANSSRLTCQKEATMQVLTDMNRCIDELEANLGDDIQEYSTTNSAKDLGFLLDILKEDGKKRFVYGVSYGTYWAQRYLTIFPEQADGVILDSICTLGNCYMDDYSYWTDIVGRQFMDVCAEDSICKAKMDTINTAGTKEAMMDVLNTSSCDFGFGALGKADMQMVFNGMLRDWFARRLIPPVVYRLNRCEARDKAALSNLMSRMYGMGKYVTEEQMQENNVLYYNIVFSELWFGRTKEYITDVFNNSLFNTGDGLSMYNMKNSNKWNEYTDEYIAQTKPETNTPVLMMNGTLDPQTALQIAEPSKEFLNKENQYFIVFPQIPHGVSSTSLTNEMVANYGQGTSCGEKMIFEFINNPTQKPNQDCLNDLSLLEWGNTGVNRGMGYQYLGTPDIWDGTPPTSKKSEQSSKFSEAMTKSLKRTQMGYFNSPELVEFSKKMQRIIK